MQILNLLDKISNKLVEKSIKVNDSDFIETLIFKFIHVFLNRQMKYSEDYVLIDIKDNFQEKETSMFIEDG